MLRGTWKEIASAAFRVKELRNELVKCMLKQLTIECCDIVSSKAPSLLRKTSAKDIRSMSLKNVCEELRNRTPLLYSTLMTIAIPKRSIQNKHLDWLPSVAMAGAVLLKQRSRMMNSVQLMLMLILKYSGHQVCSIYIYVYVCVLILLCKYGLF